MTFPLLVFALLLICQFHRCTADLTPDEIREIEFTELTKEEISALMKQTRCSKDCYNYMEASVKQIIKAMKPGEPYKMYAKVNGCKECIGWGYSTIELLRPVRGAPIPPLPGYNYPPATKYELDAGMTTELVGSGLFYDMIFKMKEMRVYCSRCELRTSTGEMVNGEFTSHWLHPKFEIMAYKRLWFAKFSRIVSARLIHPGTPSETPIECVGHKAFQKFCLQAHAEGKLDMQLEASFLQMLPAYVNADETASKQEDYPLSRVLCCEPYRFFSSEEEC